MQKTSIAPVAQQTPMQRSRRDQTGLFVAGAGRALEAVTFEAAETAGMQQSWKRGSR